MPVKRIVCLANSRKLGGRCIAGRELLETGVGGWIRPVSDRPGGELSESERRYRNGTEPRVLEIMDVALLVPNPHLHQRENWLIEPRKRFEPAGSFDRSRLGALVEPSGPLWVNGHSTANGYNDEVPTALAEGLSCSLRLIRVHSLLLFVRSYEGKKKVLGDFRHEGAAYRLPVTDPCFEEPYGARPDGKYDLGPRALCISLGEPFRETNCCHKLIATIVPLKPGATP